MGEYWSKTDSMFWRRGALWSIAFEGKSEPAILWNTSKVMVIDDRHLS